MNMKKENKLDLFYKKSSILISGGNGVRKFSFGKLQNKLQNFISIVCGKSFGGNFVEMFQC